MSQQSFFKTWSGYALALLPLLILQGLLLPLLPFSGAVPFVLPMAVVMLAAREGATVGAGYGLFVGMFAALLGEGSPMIFFLCLLGGVLGLIFRYGLQRGFLGCLAGSFVALFLLAILRMSSLALWNGASFFALLQIAIPELLWSLLFFPLVYFLYQLPSHPYPRTGGLVA